MKAEETPTAEEKKIEAVEKKIEEIEEEEEDGEYVKERIQIDECFLTAKAAQ